MDSTPETANTTAETARASHELGLMLAIANDGQAIAKAPGIVQPAAATGVRARRALQGIPANRSSCVMATKAMSDAKNGQTPSSLKKAK
jgi:hypothetical protein